MKNDLKKIKKDQTTFKSSIGSKCRCKIEKNKKLTKLLFLLTKVPLNAHLNATKMPLNATKSNLKGAFSIIGVIFNYFSKLSTSVILFPSDNYRISKNNKKYVTRLLFPSDNYGFIAPINKLLRFYRAPTLNAPCKVYIKSLKSRFIHY